MIKFRWFLLSGLMLLFVECGKVKGGSIHKGDYVGTFKIFENGTLITSTGYELELDKQRFEGESTSDNLNDESTGVFTMNAQTINFVSDFGFGSDSLLLNGEYEFDYTKQGKKLNFQKTVGTKKFEYSLVRKD